MKLTTALAATALTLAASSVALPAAPTAAASASTTPACTSSDLTASFHDRGAAAGSRYGALRLENTSGHTCTTGGWGGLSYVGHGDGTQVGRAADREGAHEHTLVLAPGDVARSRVREIVAQNYPRHRCRPTHVDGFRVYPPNETRSLYVVHPTTGCSNRGIHLISHQPYRAA